MLLPRGGFFKELQSERIMNNQATRRHDRWRLGLSLAVRLSEPKHVGSQGQTDSAPPGTGGTSVVLSHVLRGPTCKCPEASSAPGLHWSRAATRSSHTHTHSQTHVSHSGHTTFPLGTRACIHRRSEQATQRRLHERRRTKRSSPHTCFSVRDW